MTETPDAAARSTATPAAADRQAEAVVDLDAIAHNTRTLLSNTSAQLMAVVKADGYGHGIAPAARAALRGGASWLGVCTVAEALTLRRAGIQAPTLSWLVAPGVPLAPALRANIDLAPASVSFLAQVVAAARETGITARLHLKIDTGLGCNGATPADWPELVTAAGKAQADGLVEIVGIWSHFAYADEPGHPTIGGQLAVFDEAVATAERLGIRPQLRHFANSAASLTLPAAHYDMIRPGLALYGLSPIPGTEAEFGLRPAMTLRGRVVLAKRVPAGQGVSYGHEYHTSRETTLALLPFGYADGVPRAASNVGEVWLAGARRRIAGRVRMDQIVLDVGDADVTAGDQAILFGPGTAGEPTANDWADTVGTINYEIVARIGARVPRTYVGGTETEMTEDGWQVDR